MKKNFRKGGGRGSRPKSDSQQKPNENRPKGGSEDKGRSERGPRREIKNARGLRDVLGMGGGRSSGGGARLERPVHGQPTTQRDNPVSGQSKSSKLTYITNFQPPGGAPVPDQGRAKPVERQQPQRPKPIERAHPEKPQQNKLQAAPPSGSVRDVHQRDDYRWPKARLAAEAARTTKPTDAKSTVKNAGSRVEGIIKRHPDGFGFFDPE